MSTQPSRDNHTPDAAEPCAVSPTLTRRRFGRGVLLGAAGTAAAVATPATADAAPATAKWKLGGNGDVTTANFLGPTNPAPLIFKTAESVGSPVERARITSAGDVGVGLTAPTTRLHVKSSTGDAIRGEAAAGLTWGVSGEGGHGVVGLGTEVGVHGVGQFGVTAYGSLFGVYGETRGEVTGTGVYGLGANGVEGHSHLENGVLGTTDSGYGVVGQGWDDGSLVGGVWGEGQGLNNNGVIGSAHNGSAAYGVWGISTSGYAGVFSGNALVTGTLSKGGGSFKIDHPLDPANKYLYHSFVESPDMMNVYNGNVITDAEGSATVVLPSYFGVLNRDFRYQLTVLGQFAQAIIAEKINGNQFSIMTDRPSIEVSWQVTGIRQDAFANANRIPTEVSKPEDERGTYLHPAAHGKPAATDVQHERIAALTARRPERPAEPAARRPAR